MTSQRSGRGAASPTGPEAAGEIIAELQRLREENAQPRQALASRLVIDQARGMVMAVGRCTPAEAWDMLVAVSSTATRSCTLWLPSWWPRPPAVHCPSRYAEP